MVNLTRHSYIILSKETNQAVCELFDFDKVERLNTKKYYWMTAQDYLERFNRELNPVD